MDSIELIRKDVNAWRRAHNGRRGPLPVSVRERAGVQARLHGEDVVAAARL